MHVEHPTPEHDAELARKALGEHDLGHAVFHAGGALSGDPTRQEWCVLLETILQAADDPFGLTPVERQNDFITASNRAYLLALRGRYAEALSLITQVVDARPDIPYLAWAVSWVSRPGVAAAIGDEARADVLANLARLAGKFRSPMASDHPCLRNVQHSAHLAAALRELSPLDGFAFYVGSAIARRLGRFDEAIALARRSLELEPSWRSAIGLACALRDAGRIDEAIAAFRQSLVYDPADLSALLDVGDLLLSADRPGEAAAAYREALEKDAEHDWALPSFHYARFVAERDPSARAALLALRDHRPDNQRARDLADRLDPRVPYATFLVDPTDATARAVTNVLAHMRKDPKSGGTVKLSVSHVESPSVEVAFRLGQQQLGIENAFEVEVKEELTPDPRLPKGQVELVLWRWDGHRASANGPPPSPQVAAAVAAIAASDYRVDAWEAAARDVGRRLGAAYAHELLGVLVHPPAPPPEVPVVSWVFRVQIAAALALTGVDEGWEGSSRRRLLLALALGPTDWITSAAIVALGRVATTHEPARSEVLALFAHLETMIPTGGYTCFAHPLACVWAAIPGGDASTIARLQAWRERIETSADEGEAEDDEEDDLDDEERHERDPNHDHDAPEDDAWAGADTGASPVAPDAMIYPLGRRMPSLYGEHAGASLEKWLRFDAMTGGQDGSFDLASGTARIGDVAFPAQVLAVEDEEEDVLRWAWSVPGRIPEALAVASQHVRALGQQEGIEPLSQPTVSLSALRDCGAFVAKIACGAVAGTLWLRVPHPGGALWLVTRDERFALPPPDGQWLSYTLNTLLARYVLADFRYYMAVDGRAIVSSYAAQRGAVVDEQPGALIVTFAGRPLVRVAVGADGRIGTVEEA